MFGISLIKKSDLVQLREEMTLYQRQLEDLGWINLSAPDQFSSQMMFSQGYKAMLKRCKTYFYKNPLAGQWVNLTTSFVFGEGISAPKCEDEEIQKIVDEFWKDPDNQLSLTSFAAQQRLSNKIQYEGNLFFVLFEDIKGNVKVRMLNTEEVDDVIMAENDRMRPMFYKVTMKEQKYDFNIGGYVAVDQKHKFYADIGVPDPTQYNIPKDKLLEGRIFHVKMNCDTNDKFGVPDLFRGIDWAEAHKNMMEDLATLVKALSKFAWKKKIKGSASKVASIAAAMQSKMNLTNIRNTAGGTIVENEGTDLQSIDIKTGGVKVGTDTQRQAKLMVCAASGIFEHYYGDPSTGNLATAKSMELPMVKKFVNYQSLWTDIYLAILNYLIDRKVAAGMLSGKEELDVVNNRVRYVVDDEKREMDLDFPPILEEDLNAYATALSTAKTSGLVGKELAANLFMLAANVNNIEEEMEKLEEEWEEKERKEEEMRQMGIFGSPNDPQGSKDEDPSKGSQPPKPKPKTEPVKEAIAAPEKRLKARALRKENYMMEKVNGYRKVIAGSYRSFLQKLREGTKVSQYQGRAVGKIDGMYKALSEFTDGMQEAARKYYPIAVEIGEKFTQANIKDFKPSISFTESLYEAKGRAKSILEKRLFWNDTFLSNSLEPAMLKVLETTIRQEYASERELRKAINENMNRFESRLELYVGALWTVEQEAVKEAGKGMGVQVNFVGPNDTHSCEGCEEAVSGNPWPMEEAPIPGEQQCLGRCRHALQVVSVEEGISISEALEKDDFTYTCQFAGWKSNLKEGTFEEIKESEPCHAS